MAHIIDGKKISAEIRAEIAEEVKAMKAEGINPGLAVIIVGENPGEETILEAARIAAGYSKGAASSRVPVDYTLRKYVKKPSGAKPGFVIYTHQHTLYVSPDPRKEN